MNLLLKNAYLVQNGQILHQDILLRGKYIEGFFPPGEKTESRFIDLNGAYISAGFIDIHVHGGGGHDFMDGTKEAFRGAASLHLRHGTTALLPTTLATDTQELMTCFETYRQCKSTSPYSAKMLGLHLEGPYVSNKQCGALDPRYVRAPQKKEYLPLLDACPDIMRWTLAPELPGAFEMAEILRQRGIVASIGHSNATSNQVAKAIDYGFCLVTHLYSAMSTITREKGFRRAGVVESAYLYPQLSSEIIADGCHLPPELLKLAYLHIGPDRLALVTDAMRGAGQTAPTSILGSLTKGQTVLLEEGVAKLMDRSAFAGSICTADRLIRTMVYLAGVSLPDAVQMITQTPAQIMGIQKEFGTISPGRLADLTVFDHEININLVFTDGEIRYERLNNL